MRKTINGAHLKQFKKEINSAPISSKVPGKWVIVDTEDGHIYGFNENGWVNVPVKILEAARLAISRELRHGKGGLRFR